MTSSTIAAAITAILTSVSIHAAGPQLQNPSFEQGTGGYWINNPARATLDTENSSHGLQSLRVNNPANAKTSVVASIPRAPGMKHSLSFDLKGDPDTSLQMKFMLQGQKPIAFWNPPGQSPNDFNIKCKPEWTRITIAFGPVPEKLQGQDVRRVAIYFDALSGDRQGGVWIDNLELKSEEVKNEEVTSGTPPAPADSGLLKNGSFEQGLAHYWVNRKQRVSINTNSSSHGAQSITIDPAGEEKVSVFQSVPLHSGMIYKLGFDASGIPGDSVIRVAIMLQGDKPIGFWSPDAKKKFIAEFQPTEKWSRHELSFGPIPETFMGKQVRSVGIYLDIIPGKNASSVSLDNLQLKTGAPPQAALSIDLPSPVQIFEHPVPVRITAPNAAADSRINLKITDFRGNAVLEKQVPATDGISLSLADTGYFLVQAQLLDIKKKIADASTSILISTPLPDDYYNTPHPAFGVWGGLSPELLRLGGAKWTRELFFTVFQKPDFRPEAPSAEKIRQRGNVKVIRCLNVLNPFKKMVPVPENEWPAIRDKVSKELISRHQMADVWETQNEPMVGENFHGGMADVVRIISETSQLVRKHSPGTPIAGICINPMSENQYAQITGYYRNYRMAELVDALMIHPYIPNASPPDTSGYINTLTRLDKDLREITGQQVPIYISEIGYSSKPGGEVTELQQAAYLARVVLLNRTVDNLRACVWHIGLWNEAHSRRELDYGILRPHPKGSPQRQPKPAFAAWATVSRLTYNAEYIGELQLGRGIRVMLFSRQGHPLIAAYSLSNTPRNLKLPLGGSEITMTDLCGSVTKITPVNGVVEITVDEAPVYLAGNDPADIARLSSMKVDFLPDQLQAQPGTSHAVTLDSSLLATPGLGLRVEVPGGWQSAVSGDGKQRNVNIIVPPQAAPGEYTLYFHLTENKQSRIILRKEFQVLPPIELNDIRTGTGPDGQTLLLTPKSARTGEKFLISINEDGNIIAESAAVTGQALELKLPSLAFGRPRQYSAGTTLPSGLKWTVPLPALNLIPIAAVSSETDTQNWPAASSFKLETGVYSQHHIEGEFDRPEGQLLLGWTADDLIIRLSYRDRHHIATGNPANMWNADSLQIGFSPAPGDMIRRNNDGIQETSYAEIGIMPEEKGSCASLVLASTNRNNAELNQPLPGIKASWKRDGDTISYSIRLPWIAMNVKNPRPGMPLRFSLLINDCDHLAGTRHQRHWLEWYSGIANGKNPALFGDAVLR